MLECRYRRLPFRVGPTETRSEIELPMPKKASGEDGVKAKQRSKSDKAKRTFELNGTYSAKHMRLKADRDEKTSAKKAALTILLLEKPSSALTSSSKKESVIGSDSLAPLPAQSFGIHVPGSRPTERVTFQSVLAMVGDDSSVAFI